LAHPSRGNCREGRSVTARKRTLALSRSLAARARAELDQEIERLQRTEEAIVVATVTASADAVVLGVKAVEMGGVRAA
jgi:hypothetical protein